ncbi:MAG TPA: hypothetical protein VM689_24015 [Aliidongia sp.]|nr:hypothetical protein [Aliidongia sp.]
MDQRGPLFPADYRKEAQEIPALRIVSFSPGHAALFSLVRCYVNDEGCTVQRSIDTTHDERTAHRLLAYFKKQMDAPRGDGTLPPGMPAG